ncbi:hypothetical protein [Streptomyces sp. ATexAB-D23]|uniref:hypothetical protein n=1 Tax=unclassified Streptomyces TaxID=2593676 RepID=UPI0018F8909B|nr:hypothetical protein [Streptomyces sp. ATexAB-D23]
MTRCRSPHQPPPRSELERVAALIAVAFAKHWHRTTSTPSRRQQTLVHLQTTYAQVAVPVLDDLARRTPGVETKQRYARHLQQAVLEHADRILQDPAWDALATTLADAETADHNPATLLDPTCSR